MLDLIASGALAGGDPNLFRPLVDNLLCHDPFLVLADYQAYVDARTQVSALWRDAAGLDAQVHPQRRADGQVLVRPLDPRLLRAGLEGEAGHGGLGRLAFARAGFGFAPPSRAAWTPFGKVARTMW